MARKTGSSSEKTIRAVRVAALRLFAERGYHAVSMRAISGTVDMQAAALYNYWPTKQHLLLDLMTAHMDELLEALDAALPSAGSPSERLTAFIRFHIRHHISRPAAVFVAYMELRSLEPDNFGRVACLRRAYESRLREILDAGAAQGVFELSDAKMTTLGIIAQLTGLTTWYRPGGRLSASEIEDIYVDMTARMVGARVSGEPLCSTPQ